MISGHVEVEQMSDGNKRAVNSNQVIGNSFESDYTVMTKRAVRVPNRSRLSVPSLLF